MCCEKNNIKDVVSGEIIFCPQRIYIPLSLSVGGAADVLDIYCRVFKYLFRGRDEVRVHDGGLHHPSQIKEKREFGDLLFV